MKDDLIFLEHILESIYNIESFSKRLSKEFFLKNRLKQSAIIRELEIIGEAVKNISNEFRNKNPNIEWNKIAGFRDKMIHHYFGVSLERVWIVIKDDLPNLKNKILEIKKDLEKEKAK